MGISTHPVAIFEEGFILIGVTEDDVDQVGAPQLWRMFQEHPWIVEQGIPVAIVYDSSTGMRAHGDLDLVHSVTQMNFDDIIWGHELTLEW